MEITELLNPTQVSKILNISRQQVYRLLQLGVIPVIRIGKSVRVSSNDLQAFIQNSRSKQEFLVE